MYAINQLLTGLKLPNGQEVKIGDILEGDNMHPIVAKVNKEGRVIFVPHRSDLPQFQFEFNRIRTNSGIHIVENINLVK